MSVDGGIWGSLTARRMALLREKPVTLTFANGATLPVTLHAGEKLEFDTGRIVQAYLVIEMNADKDSGLSIEPFEFATWRKPGLNGTSPLTRRPFQKRDCSQVRKSHDHRVPPDRTALSI